MPVFRHGVPKKTNKRPFQAQWGTVGITIGGRAFSSSYFVKIAARILYDSSGNRQSVRYKFKIVTTDHTIATKVILHTVDCKIFVRIQYKGMEFDGR